MSHYDYSRSQYLEATSEPFYALIMTAMRQADTDNLGKLVAMWPDVWDELKARYNSPGGYLSGEEAAS